MLKESNVKIYVTDELDRFKFIPENRDIKAPIRTKWLEYCLMKLNLLKIMPIVINQDWEVTDGQRRLTVARKLKLPIYFIKSNLITEENLMLANTGSENWDVHDYISYFAKRGNNHYILLQKFCKNYHVPPSTAVMFSGKLFGGAHKTDTIKQGHFKWYNYSAATKGIEKILEFGKYVDFAKKKSFIEAMIQIMRHKKFSYRRMTDKFIKYSYKMRNCASNNDFTAMLEEFYNKGLSPENKLRFYGS